MRIPPREGSIGGTNRRLRDRRWERPGGRARGSAAGLTLGVAGLRFSLGQARVLHHAARAEAAGSRRPLLVDFTAAWCVACKELDKRTFSDPSVAREAGRFLAVKVDMTHETPATETLKEQQAVLGLPTVIAFDSTGKEAVRCTDFVPAREFLRVLEGVR